MFRAKISFLIKLEGGFMESSRIPEEQAYSAPLVAPESGEVIPLEIFDIILANIEPTDLITTRLVSHKWEERSIKIIKTGGLALAQSLMLSKS